MGENKDLFDAKLYVISDILEISIKRTKNNNSLKITIFTNSQTTLAKMIDFQIKIGKNIIQALI